MTKRSKTGVPPGSGKIVSRTPTTVHTHKYGQLYFRRLEDLERYRWKEVTRKRAKRAGWPHSTDADLEKFAKWDAAIKEEMAKKKELEAKRKAELKAIREELGLHTRQQLRLARIQDEQGKLLDYARRANASKMTDAEKVEAIKKMIEDRTPITDFMIRTSQLVGAKL